MDERAVLKVLEGLGYQLLPRTHCRCPGGRGLLVAIRREPTHKHFDPERIHLRLSDRWGMAKCQSLHLLSPTPASYRVCPGRVILSDRSGRCVEFFTFGGSLEVVATQAAHLCELRSPVPVLELVGEEEMPADQLAAETESLLGRAKAQWRRDEDGFNRRLAEIEPLPLYLGTLTSLIEQYEHSHALEEIYHELCDVIRHEKGWFVSQGLWPKKPYRLEELLAPGCDPNLFTSS